MPWDGCVPIERKCIGKCLREREHAAAVRVVSVRRLIDELIAEGNDPQIREVNDRVPSGVRVRKVITRRNAVSKLDLPVVRIGDAWRIGLAGRRRVALAIETAGLEILLQALMRDDLGS